MHIELRIDISTPAESSALMMSMLETVRRPDGSDGRSVFRLSTLRLRGQLSFRSMSDVESRTAPPVPNVRIGSAIEQQLRDIVMVIVEREHQRGHTFGCRDIHIGAGADQRVDAVVAAVAGGVRAARSARQPDDTAHGARR